ncbi:hypothetical protein K0U07_00695 [bacterium]|nr:hypothetical protein [bacterium]
MDLSTAYELNAGELQQLLIHTQKILLHNKKYGHLSTRLRIHNSYPYLYIKQANNNTLLKNIAGIFNEKIACIDAGKIIFRFIKKDSQHSGILVYTERKDQGALLSILRKLKKG